MYEARFGLLQGTPLFGGVSAGTLQYLLGSCPIVTVVADAYFFREGEQGDCMYVLEAGKVHVLKSWHEWDYRLDTLETGDCFGEMAVIDHCQRSASVRAVEDCTAIKISSATLHRLYEDDLKQFTLIQMNMGREVSRRLRDADDRLFAARLGNLQADLAAQSPPADE